MRSVVAQYLELLLHDAVEVFVESHQGTYYCEMMANISDKQSTFAFWTVTVCLDCCR